MPITKGGDRRRGFGRSFVGESVGLNDKEILTAQKEPYYTYIYNYN
jgi:hypothetical protein